VAVVGETSEYSYEDVQAQIRAEEEASKAEEKQRKGPAMKSRNAPWGWV